MSSEQRVTYAAVIQSAAKQGGATALAGALSRVSYVDLLARVGRLAGVFHRVASTNSSHPIAIVGDKTIRTVEAILAACHGGLGYTFLNPKQRAARLSSMVEQLRPSLIVDLGSDEWDHDPHAIAHGTPVLRFPDELPEDPIEPIMRADGCAYALFTSGSTGRPKGVIVSHSAAWHAQQAFVRDVGLTKDDIVCSEMGFGFDVSTIDIFSTLAVGATLDVTPEPIVEDAHALFRHLVERRITRLFTCPTAARMVLEAEPDAAAQLSRLKLCLTGELIPARLAELMKPMIADGRVWNQYGATEFPFGLSRQLSVDDVKAPNIINNPTVGSPVKVRLSDLGDVTLVGPGLFSGYVSPDTDFSAPLLTVESFMTGDRAEPDAIGILRLLGRSDNQCRKDGHRIELREIECAAERHADVDLCYVTYDAAANQIIARVTAKGSPTTRLDLSAIGKHLERYLPDYMLPARIEQLAEAPRTLSGKKRYTSLADARIIH